MSRLLVSVRDATEARAAMAGGADLIDVKEPTRGSLGAPDPGVIAEIVAEIGGRRPMSAALGELIDQDVEGVAEMPARRFRGLTFAKLGLAHCRSLADWPRRWAGVLNQFPNDVSPVAVIYADWREAAAPPPNEILEHGRRFRCRAILLDTFDKSRGSLLDLWTLPQIAGLVRDARDAGLNVVLAGSLTTRSITDLLPLEPDYFAVRGAVCSGGRDGMLEQVRVQELAGLLGSYHFQPERIPASLITQPSGQCP